MKKNFPWPRGLKSLCRTAVAAYLTPGFYYFQSYLRPETGKHAAFQKGIYESLFPSTSSSPTATFFRLDFELTGVVKFKRVKLVG